MTKNSTRNIIKIIVAIFIILIIIGGIAVVMKTNNDGEKDNEEDNVENSTTQKTEEKKEESASKSGIFLSFLIVIVMIIVIFFVMKKSPQFYKLMSDEETRDLAKNILLKQYGFNLENDLGSTVYFIPYYSNGDKRWPRAIVGWNIKQRMNFEQNVDPIKESIIAIDINRRDPKTDHRLLGSMTREDAETYIHNVLSGKTSQSPAPHKQEKTVISEAQQEAIKEFEKDELKGRLKK